MDPVTLVVWGAILVVALLGFFWALKAFGRLMTIGAGLLVIALIVGMIVDPAATTAKFHSFVAGVQNLVTQLRNALPR